MGAYSGMSIWDFTAFECPYSVDSYRVVVALDTYEEGVGWTLERHCLHGFMHGVGEIVAFPLTIQVRLEHATAGEFPFPILRFSVILITDFDNRSAKFTDDDDNGSRIAVPIMRLSCVRIEKMLLAWYEKKTVRTRACLVRLSPRPFLGF